jgi:hypothetical protein
VLCAMPASVVLIILLSFFLLYHMRRYSDDLKRRQEHNALKTIIARMSEADSKRSRWPAQSTRGSSADFASVSSFQIAAPTDSDETINVRRGRIMHAEKEALQNLLSHRILFRCIRNTHILLLSDLNTLVALGLHVRCRTRKRGYSWSSRIRENTCRGVVDEFGRQPRTQACGEKVVDGDNAGWAKSEVG